MKLLKRTNFITLIAFPFLVHSAARREEKPKIFLDDLGHGNYVVNFPQGGVHATRIGDALIYTHPDDPKKRELPRGLFFWFDPTVEKISGQRPVFGVGKSGGKGRTPFIQGKIKGKAAFIQAKNRTPWDSSKKFKDPSRTVALWRESMETQWQKEGASFKKTGALKREEPRGAGPGAA